MPLLDRLTSRALSLLGLSFDFSMDPRTEPFHAITPRVLLGARPLPEQLPKLREAGVTHVLSCLEPHARPTVVFLERDFETLFVPLRDGAGEDIAAHFPHAFDFIDAAGPSAKVLVHCQVGVSRSATLVTAQVMRTERLRFYDAYQRVRAQRAQVLPNVGFAAQLQALEHALFPDACQRPSSLARYLHEVCCVPVELDVLQDMLERHDFDALRAIHAIFGDEVPRVIQGVRF